MRLRQLSVMAAAVILVSLGFATGASAMQKAEQGVLHGGPLNGIVVEITPAEKMLRIPVPTDSGPERLFVYARSNRKDHDARVIFDLTRSEPLPASPGRS